MVDGGNFVTKVIYLPDPKYQELAIAGVETLVSTRLEPGVDPILEADKRGTILLIVRLGAIDLEMPGGGMSVPNAVNMPAPDGSARRRRPPGSLPAGLAAAGRDDVADPESVPVDNAPVTPAPPAPRATLRPPADAVAGPPTAPDPAVPGRAGAPAPNP